MAVARETIVEALKSLQRSFGAPPPFKPTPESPRALSNTTQRSMIGGKRTRYSFSGGTS